MKISIDVDVSPQEARELFGWPDLSQLHETTLSALNEQLANGNQEALMAMLKPYLASIKSFLKTWPPRARKNKYQDVLCNSKITVT